MSSRASTERGLDPKVASASARRLGYFRLVVVVVAVAGTTVVGVGEPSRRGAPMAIARLRAAQAALDEQARPVCTARQKARALAFRRAARPSNVDAMPFPPGTVVALVDRDDPLAAASLERHVANVDVVVPDWFELASPGQDLVEHADEKTRRILRRSETSTVPRLSSGASPASGVPADAGERATLIARLVGRLASLGADGLDVELGGLRAGSPALEVAFLDDLRAALHARSLRLAVEVTLGAPLRDVGRIGKIADVVMLMVPEEGGRSLPAPLAAHSAFEDALDQVLPRLDVERVVVVLSTLGVDRTHGPSGVASRTLSFPTIMELASGVGAFPTFDAPGESSFFAYRDPAGLDHDVWFEDALVLWNRMLSLRHHHVTGVGLRKLGAEDESVWALLGADAVPTSPSVLERVPPSSAMRIAGQGEVYAVREDPAAGERIVVASADGGVLRGAYASLPSGYVVEALHGQRGELALTFDDGPDERNTGSLLDALGELHVPATFFVVGNQAAAAPALVEREVREAHLLGNHSFTHPHLEQLTPLEADAELAVTAQTTGAISGRRTALFRAPYVPLIRAAQASDLTALEAALRNGYVFVGAAVDPDDWQPKSADTIARDVVAQVTRGAGSVVILHDGGGERSQTIEAVRLLVPDLEARGYRFVPLDALLGLKREQLQLPSDRALSSSSRSH